MFYPGMRPMTPIGLSQAKLPKKSLLLLVGMAALTMFGIVTVASNSRTETTNDLVDRVTKNAKLGKDTTQIRDDELAIQKNAVEQLNHFCKQYKLVRESDKVKIPYIQRIKQK